MRIFRSWPILVLLFGAIGVIGLYTLSVVAHPHAGWRSRTVTRVTQSACQDCPFDTPQSVSTCETDVNIEAAPLVEHPNVEDTYVDAGWALDETVCEIPVKIATSGEAPSCTISICDIPGCQAPTEENAFELAVENAHLSAAIEAHEQHHEYAEMLAELAVSQVKAKLKLKATKQLHKQLAQVQQQRDALQTQLTLLIHEQQLLAETLAQQIRIHKLVAKLHSSADPKQQQAIDELLAESSTGLSAIQQKLAHCGSAPIRVRTASTSVLYGPVPANGVVAEPQPQTAEPSQPILTVTPRIIIQEEEEEVLGIDVEIK